MPVYTSNKFKQDQTEILIAQAKTAQAYSERNQLVALLTKIFPSWIGVHEDINNWDPEWKNVVYIELPTGQVSWHIHNDEMPMFAHLWKNPARKWDGHTVEEKYERIRKFKEEK